MLVVCQRVKAHGSTRPYLQMISLKLNYWVSESKKRGRETCAACSRGQEGGVDVGLGLVQYSLYKQNILLFIYMKHVL